MARYRKGEGPLCGGKTHHLLAHPYPAAHLVLRTRAPFRKPDEGGRSGTPCFCECTPHSASTTKEGEAETTALIRGLWMGGWKNS